MDENFEVDRIERMSRSLGAGFAVTKVPQTKMRRSFPVAAASSTRARRRVASHRRLGEQAPNRVKFVPISNVDTGRQLPITGQIG
jgi:hypothetical protein